MTRDQILTILYEMAMVIGGEVNLKPLLSKTLQRLMYHTSFPAGLVFMERPEQTVEGNSVKARLELAIGDFELAEQSGSVISVPAGLLQGPPALVEDRALIDSLPCRKNYYSVFLRLPIDGQGVILLLSPELPRTDLPITTVFQPVLANFAKAILLCRRNEAYTTGILAERDQAQAGLARFRAAMDTSFDGVLLIDPEAMRLIDFNRAAGAASGYSHEELLTMGPQDLMPGFSRDGFDSLFGELTAGRRQEVSLDTMLRRKNGGEFPVEARFTVLLQSSQGHLIIGLVRDITERKQAEQELQRLNRALRMVSLCNEALIHANDEAQLLQDVCRIIVETGQYRLVWVGLAEQDEARTVRPVAQAGADDTYLQGLHLTWSDAEQGPVATAIRENRVCTVADVGNAEAGLLGRETLPPGVASMVALPLTARRQTLGVLNIYSDTPAAFSPAEIDVLRENAGDLAFGIAQLRRNQNLIRLGKAMANAGEGICITDMSGDIVYGNTVLAEWFGSSGELNAAGGPLAMFEQRDTGATILETVRRDGSWHGEVALRRHDGTAFPGFVQADTVKDELGHMLGLVGIVTDLTEPKRAQEKIQDALRQAIEAISLTVEMRDPYTAGHQNRVADLAIAIAREMGLPEEQIRGLHLAGIVHDLGKIRIPAEILSKPGRLNEVEYQMIRIHPDAGYDILKGIDFPWPIADIVRQHQERLDGSGYPLGLKGDEILLEAKILAVADTVEAMASHRPYRPSKGEEAALEEIRLGRGVRYDPAVVDACLRVFERGATGLWGRH